MLIEFFIIIKFMSITFKLINIGKYERILLKIRK